MRYSSKFTPGTLNPDAILHAETAAEFMGARKMNGPPWESPPAYDSVHSSPDPRNAGLLARCVHLHAASNTD